MSKYIRVIVLLDIYNRLLENLVLSNRQRSIIVMWSDDLSILHGSCDSPLLLLWMDFLYIKTLYNSSGGGGGE